MIFLIRLSLSFKKRYPTITFSITVKAHSGAITVTFPSWYALSCTMIEHAQDNAVIRIAFLFPFMNSSFISDGLILSKSIIRIDGTSKVSAT